MDVLVEGLQLPELFEVEEKEGLQAMVDGADPVAECDDLATCSRPVNENVLERFLVERMNEPY